MRFLRLLPGLLAVYGLLPHAHAEPLPAESFAGAEEGEQQTRLPEDTAAPLVLPLKLALEPTPLAARKPLFFALRSNMRNMLSLHKMIETTPLVVGGLTVYVEAEAVATHQRNYNSSRLTVGLAPDRVVLYGAF